MALALAASTTLVLIGLPVSPAAAATWTQVSPDPVLGPVTTGPIIRARNPVPPTPPLIVIPEPGAPVGPAISWKVPVAMYHIVTPLAPDTANTGLFVRSSEFDAQMKAMAAKGIRTITAHDLGASIAAHVNVPPKVAVLTFDDGRAEMIRYAWPIMEKYGTSLVFNGRKWVIRDVDHDGIADRGFIGTFYIIAGRSSGLYLTFDQQATLARAGNEIGNHTQAHSNVQTLHGSALIAAIVTAGHTLEPQLLKRGIVAAVKTFAYPYGDTSTEAVNLLKANYYTLAFTTVPGIAHSGQNILLLPRVRVGRGESGSAFVAALGF